MRTDDQHKWPGQLLAQQSDMDYRTLERHYRQSPQYAAMVARYPQLRQSIEACGTAELVDDAPQRSSGPSGVDLKWERSHGED